jgi:hypothetical protein
MDPKKSRNEGVRIIGDFTDVAIPGPGIDMPKKKDPKENPAPENKEGNEDRPLPPNASNDADENCPT